MEGLTLQWKGQCGQRHRGKVKEVFGDLEDSQV